MCEGAEQAMAWMVSTEALMAVVTTSGPRQKPRSLTRPSCVMRKADAFVVGWGMG